MIVMYATTKEGEGYTQEIGRFDSLEEINIRIRLFSPETVITLEEEKDEEVN